MRHKESAPTPTNLVIPELVPDDEPVEVADPFETTSPGLAGFSVGRPKDPTAERRPATSGHASSQRREMFEHFQDLAKNAEANYEQPVSSGQQALGRQALGSTARHL